MSDLIPVEDVWRELDDKFVYIDWVTMSRVKVIARNREKLQLRLKCQKTGAEEDMALATFLARYRRQDL